MANCFREKWYESWEKNKWKNAARKSVENQELWKELLSLVRKLPESAALAAMYEKFLCWNGSSFSYDDFIYITKMNNVVDGLAGKGIDSVRDQASAV